jgi:phage-related protein
VTYHGHPSLGDWIKDTASKAWDGIKDAGKWVADTVTAGATWVADKVVSGAKTVGSWVADKAGDAWEAVKGAAGTVRDWFTDAGDTVVEYAGKGKEKVEEGVRTIVTGAGGAASKAASGLTGAIERLLAWIKDLLDKIATILGTAFTNAMDAITALPATLMLAVRELSKMFSIDEDTFVEDNLKFAKLQKELSAKISIE